MVLRDAILQAQKSHRVQCDHQAFLCLCPWDQLLFALYIFAGLVEEQFFTGPVLVFNGTVLHFALGLGFLTIE